MNPDTLNAPLSERRAYVATLLLCVLLSMVIALTLITLLSDPECGQNAYFTFVQSTPFGVAGTAAFAATNLAAWRAPWRGARLAASLVGVAALILAVPHCWVLFWG